MADTITSVSTDQGIKQFPGWFKEAWHVKATIDDQDAVALTSITEFDLTVAGVALGDMVLTHSLSLDLNDGTNEALCNVYVSAADTLTVQIMADEAEFAADSLNTAVFKAVVVRPNW